MTTYDACKLTILNGKYGAKEEMMFKLDIFLLGNRITQDQYNELVELLNEQEVA